MTQPILLSEYQPTHLPADRLTQPEAERLWEQFRPVVQLDPPSFKNNNRWVIIPQGWAGHIQLSPKTTLVIRPKVSVQNLFAVLQQVYGLPRFSWLDGVSKTETLEGFWDLLAGELADRVLDRLRKGITKEYVSKQELVGVIRGRIDTRHLATESASPQLKCDFAEQTADLPHNQLLAYTLRQISLTGLCSSQVLMRVNRAWRQMPVEPVPFTSHETLGFEYTRLTEDYRPMHALCRLFLDGLEPTHHHSPDGAQMLPFLLNMPQLYEKFVAHWLSKNLPDGYTLREQERVRLDASQARHVEIDLVIYDRDQEPVMVLDTKYKAGEPSNDDIYQVTFYAREIGCQSAGLVYPIQPTVPLHGQNKDVAYRSLTFSLDNEPQAAGEAFLNQLDL